jgi:hypothetical protein
MATMTATMWVLAPTMRLMGDEESKGCKAMVMVTMIAGE